MPVDNVRVAELLREFKEGCDAGDKLAEAMLRDREPPDPLDSMVVTLGLKSPGNDPILRHLTHTDEMEGMMIFRGLADGIMESGDMDVRLSSFAARYLPALVDKVLDPPPSPQHSQDLQDELQIHNAHFLMLYFLRTTISVYYLKYIRSRKEIAARGRLLPVVLSRRLLKVIPIWERLGYMEKPPFHWLSLNTETKYKLFSLMPTPGIVLWMVSTFASDFAKVPGWTEDILPPDLRNDLYMASKRWTAKYGKKSIFGLNSFLFAEGLTEEGLDFAKTIRAHTHGVFGGWHSCALSTCKKTEDTSAEFKACSRVLRPTRKNIGKRNTRNSALKLRINPTNILRFEAIPALRVKVRVTAGFDLPSSRQSPAIYSALHKGARSSFQRHRLQFIIAFVVAIFLFLFVLSPSSALKSITRPGAPQIYKETTSTPTVPPPKYERLREWEKNLPQHNASLPYPEGKNGRYVLFSNQIKMLGWNNVLNEVLMNAHLAHASKRAYVFQEYVWKPEYYPWPENQRLRNPPHTPLGALIAGPTVGEPWGEGDNSPRSVSEEYYNQVCPKHKRRIIGTDDVKPILAWKEGLEIFEYWQKLLGDAPENCIEVVPTGPDQFPQTFDLWLFGAERILSLWDNFRTSATSQLLRTAPITAAAVSRNEYLFTPRGPRPEIPVSPNPYDRMLSMHIRRGDFKGACVHLMTWNSTFYSWNQLPELPDPLIFPKEYAWNSPEYVDIIMQRCLPEADVIVRKARHARDDYVRASKGKKRTLDILYLLTNEKGEWLAKMKEELIKDGWHTIVTSNDLELDSEGIETSMAIDMEIARLAAVFIGNGWSSFTSNIVHRRLVDKREPISTRFF